MQFILKQPNQCIVLSFGFSSWKVRFIKIFSLDMPRWQVGDLDHRINKPSILKGLFAIASYIIISVDGHEIFHPVGEGEQLWLERSLP